MRMTLALLVFVAVLGAMAAGPISDAVAAWSAAQVQIAQIDANVKTFQIGVDAVQRANDRSFSWFALGVLATLAGPALFWLMRHNESEASYHERRAKFSERQRAIPAPPVQPWLPDVPHVDDIADVWVRLPPPRQSVGQSSETDRPVSW